MLLPLFSSWLTIALAIPASTGGGGGGGGGGRSAGGWRGSLASQPRSVAGSSPGDLSFSPPNFGTLVSSKPKSDPIFGPPKFATTNSSPSKHRGTAIFGPGSASYDHSISTGGQSGELNVSQAEKPEEAKWDFASKSTCLLSSDNIIFFNTTETLENITIGISTQWHIHYPKELERALKQNLQGVTMLGKTPRGHWENDVGERWCGWYDLRRVTKIGVNRGDILVHHNASSEAHPVQLNVTYVSSATLEKIEAILLRKYPTVEIVLCVLFPLVLFISVAGFYCVIKPIRKAKKNGRVIGGTPMGGMPLH